MVYWLCTFSQHSNHLLVKHSFNCISAIVCSVLKIRCCKHSWVEADRIKPIMDGKALVGIIHVDVQLPHHVLCLLNFFATYTVCEQRLKNTMSTRTPITKKKTSLENIMLVTLSLGLHYLKIYLEIHPPWTDQGQVHHEGIHFSMGRSNIFIVQRVTTFDLKGKTKIMSIMLKAWW